MELLKKIKVARFFIETRCKGKNSLRLLTSYTIVSEQVKYR